MGDFAVKPIRSEKMRHRFLKTLLREVKALDLMVQEGRFEREKLRIGAEQELCLIDEDGEPSLLGPEILTDIDDPHFTSEIGRFNLEINLDPFELRSDCLRNTERQLLRLLSLGDGIASDHGARFVLSGILPSLTHRHLLRKNMTPEKRYYLLSDVMKQQRGADFEIHIQGVDELMARLDTVLFEACNTSFQLHLQIPSEDFVDYYNWAQLISAPVLATAVNSPLLFGRELWMETRIALFQQSIDTRRSTNILRERQPRVYFGNRWLHNSVSELFKDHITRFPLILANEAEEDALAVLHAGNAPKLRSLRLHNGTVYTWNRPCYGVSQNRAHLRIENRYLPAGPTVADGMANFAFWLGLMRGIPPEKRKFYQDMSFQAVKDNFYRAARYGLHTVFCWFGKEWDAGTLIREELLPMARKGLEQSGVNSTDIDRYLGIIEDRVGNRRNGAQWQIDNFRRLSADYGSGVATVALTQAIRNRQENGTPVHQWTNIDSRKVYTLDVSRDKVCQFMSTDLYSVREQEPLEFVKTIMDWKKIRHLPVEDAQDNLIGLVTHTNLRHFQEIPEEEWGSIPIREMMVKNLITVSPDTPISSAARLMKTYGVGCLPVVQDNKLLGLITDTDVKRIMGEES